MTTDLALHPPQKRTSWQRRSRLILVLVLFALLVKFILDLLLPHHVTATGEMLHLQLTGGPFQVPFFNSSKQPKGIVILCTGNGGWSCWEENTARHLAETGYAVGGWDCRKFADSRPYGQAQLCAGFASAVSAVRKHTLAPAEIPVLYVGWSTGAEQAVAAATCADRPPHLVGLLLAAPGTRGRYGITTSDLLGVTPTGPDTFALSDMVAKLKGLRVVQFAAGLDPLDDVDWIKHLSSPYLLIKLPGKLHDMGNAGPEFLARVDEAIAWTLKPTTPPTP